MTQLQFQDHFANFIYLLRSGSYDQIFFYRVDAEKNAFGPLLG
jgi:hypothetical protein